MNADIFGFRTPLQFHTTRGYLSAGRKKSTNEAILVYNVRCQHQGCGWSTRYSSREARETGIWLHRQAEILRYRLEKIGKVVTTPDGINDLLRLLADNTTHTFTAYMISVDTILQGLLPNIDSDDIPDFNYRRQYALGICAGDCAEQAMAMPVII